MAHFKWGALNPVSIVLRDYQEKAIAELREHIRHGRDPLLVAPCGSGKGSLIAYIVDRMAQKGKRIIFAVHGKSLVADMSQRVAKLGIEHGVLMGGHKRQRWHGVQVASIDTLHRMEDPPHADLVIVDEAHMALSPTWRKALARYTCRTIGMTATPTRLDGKGLGRKSGGLFDVMVMGPTQEELIKQGHLVGSRVLAPPAPADLATIRNVDTADGQRKMAKVCDRAKVIGDAVKHWEKYANGAKTAVFAVDQAHAQHVAEQFRGSGYSWAYVDCNTKLDERERIWNDLDHGDLRGVVSVGVTTVGWDHPIVSCLVILRLTGSLGLHHQILGRGSRPHPGKTHFLVLDHVGATGHHEPYGCFEDAVPWSLDGDAVKHGDAEKQERYVTCKVPALVNGEIKYPCYAVFRAGPRECPYCSLPIVKKVAKVEVVNGELEEYHRHAEITFPDGQTGTGHSFHQMRVFKSIIEDAEKRPRVVDKVGWAVSIFTDRFGVRPPKEWIPR